MVRHDLLMRLINSIDYPVEQLVILCQGSDPFLSELGEVRKVEYYTTNQNIKSVVLVQSDMNMGVARGWNYIFKHFPAPYWLISGADNYFTPNTLQEIATTMRENPDALQSVFMGMYMRRQKNSLVGESEQIPAGFNVYVVTPRLIEKVGMFDENIYPAYFEDNDLWHRIELSGEKTGNFSESCVIISGDDQFVGSCTLHSVSPDYRRKMDQCFSRNEKYFHTKWNRPPNHFKRPFNRPDCSWTQTIFHENYFKNQEIVLGHRRRPAVKITEFASHGT